LTTGHAAAPSNSNDHEIGDSWKLRDIPEIPETFLEWAWAGYLSTSEIKATEKSF
jgi:hypothetical protein